MINAMLPDTYTPYHFGCSGRKVNAEYRSQLVCWCNMRWDAFQSQQAHTGEGKRNFKLFCVEAMLRYGKDVVALSHCVQMNGWKWNGMRCVNINRLSTLALNRWWFSVQSEQNILCHLTSCFCEWKSQNNIPIERLNLMRCNKDYYELEIFVPFRQQQLEWVCVILNELANFVSLVEYETRYSLSRIISAIT